MISDYFEEATFRDSIHQHRKDSFGNYANATVSLLKCQLSKNKEQFIERKVDVESASVVEREQSLEKAMKFEAIACYEIRNLVNFFNKSLWPKERLDQYQATLQKTSTDNEIIEEFGRQIEVSLKSKAKLNDEYKALSLQHLLRMAELKSEYLFMNKMRIASNDKLKNEELLDNEQILNLVSVCEVTKKKLKLKVEKMKGIETIMKMCLKLEKLTDRRNESSEEAFEEPLELFLTKVSKIEADCVLLRNYKKYLLLNNENLKARIKQESHEHGVRQNMAMLRLDNSPSVGIISQISHEIHQIKTSVNLRNRFKLCKACKKQLAT